MEVLEAKHCKEIFPLEIWEKVLGNLDSKDLLTSRFVCNDWSEIVNRFHEAKIWKPQFPRSNFADALLIFRNKGIGTRFSSGEEVKQFMETLEGFSENQDPFINGTLILQCRSVPEYAGLFKAFPTLVARFGNSIRHCVYYVHREVLESVRNIRTILELTNLHSLSIYCAAWNKGEYLKMYLRRFKFGVQTPKKLNSITVLGLDNHEFLQVLFSTNLPHVRRLNYWGYNGDGGISLTTGSLAYPNIEELKISDITKQEVAVLGMLQWPLKRLSLKINAKAHHMTLVYTLDCIKTFAGTLESFHLQLGEGQLVHDTLHENLDFHFPKVTDFTVSYELGKQYINEFSKIFMNMTHFQLVSDEYLFPDMVSTDNCVNQIDAIENVVKPLWEMLPDKVQLISVRYRKYSEENKRHSMIHRYVQKRSKI